MQVREIMSRDFETVASRAMLRDAAQQMRELDIGMLPVEEDGRIVGALTDRDITIRATATGADPETTPVGNVMSSDIFACAEDDDLQQAARIMEDHQVRRLMVKDRDGEFVGVLALADLANNRESAELGGEVLEEVSEPGHLA